MATQNARYVRITHSTYIRPDRHFVFGCRLSVRANRWVAFSIRRCASCVVVTQVRLAHESDPIDMRRLGTMLVVLDNGVAIMSTATTMNSGSTMGMNV